MKQTISAITVVALLFVSAKLACGEDEIQVQTLDDLKLTIQKVIGDSNIPGLGIAMVNKEGPVWVTGLGLANVEKQIPANEHTLFRIGSVSKMFVGLAILKLVEEGKVSLDDTLADLAPDVVFTNRWESTDPVRLVHLLEHTTGWDNLHFVEYAHNDPTPVTLKQGLDFHPHSRVCRWIPGSRMAYTSSGIAAAAYVVEKVTNTPFEQYIKECFFDPLGMETATYFLEDTVRIHGATLYSGGKQEHYWHHLMRPAGAINASAMDMGRFLSVFIHRGKVNETPLIRESSLNRMETACSNNAAKIGMNTGCGLANFMWTYHHAVYRGHEGNIGGCLTHFSYLPEAGVGHVVMMNTENKQAMKRIIELVRVYETRDLMSPTIATDYSINDDHRSLQGYYYPINPRFQMLHVLDHLLTKQRIWMEGDRLCIKGVLGGIKRAYLPISDEIFKDDEAGVAVLAACQDPLVGDVIHYGDTTLKRAAAFSVWSEFVIAGLWLLLSVISILFFPIWITRRWMKKIQGQWTLHIRLWPLLAGISMFSFLTMMIIGLSDAPKYLGNLTLVSVGSMVTSILFAVFSLVSMLVSILAWKQSVNRFVYIHSGLLSVTHILVTIYLLYFGVIGIRTWV